MPPILISGDSKLIISILIITSLKNQPLRDFFGRCLFFNESKKEMLNFIFGKRSNN